MRTFKLTDEQTKFLLDSLRQRLESLKNYNLVLHDASTISYYDRNDADEIRLRDLEDNVRKQCIVEQLIQAIES